MNAVQKTLVAVTMIVAVATGIYEVRQAAILRTQVQTLQRQRASLSEEIQQLLRERNDSVKAEGTSTGILADPNFKMVIHALAQQNGFEDLPEPKVTTISGRGENRMANSIVVINAISAEANPQPH